MIVTAVSFKMAALKKASVKKFNTNSLEISPRKKTEIIVDSQNLTVTLRIDVQVINENK